ncbi:MAG: hypothetical protein OIF35_10110, partial [Cellvibrionaceae bacterium]|nr:hypothetical protein [Cellvibrionaceae bacterium]
IESIVKPGLFLGEINLVGLNMAEILNQLESSDYRTELTEHGFQLRNGSVSFYSHSFDSNLAIFPDAITLRFQRANILHFTIVGMHFLAGC